MSAIFLTVVAWGQSPAAEPKTWTPENLDDLVSLYQHFHRTPELSFHEANTAARLAKELKSIAVQVTTDVGGHGVVGILENGDGPVIMVRCDLDALPVVEKTGLPYASTVRTKNDDGVDVGVMHACGHDIHITNLIGVARYMAAHQENWSGTIMFIGQPAEEHGRGAMAMLKDGLFTRFRRPDFALALHVDSSLPTGFVGYRPGYATSNVDIIDITVKGRGGHGAYPHTVIDPIVQASLLVIDLQSLVSREVSPLEPAVVSVGSIHGGTKHNIIPESCHLQLTVRSHTDHVREQLRAAIVRKANAIAQSYAAPLPMVKVSEGSPALMNDERLIGRVVPAFQRVLGPEKVVTIDRLMGGEDFARYGRAGVPIFMYKIGALGRKRLDDFGRKGTSPPSLHSPLFYPDPRETLETGVVTMTSALLELLPVKK
jgi:hippurate hydrolase